MSNPVLPDPQAEDALPNTGLIPPTVGADDDTWGDILNSDLALLDALFAPDGTGPGVGLQIGAGKRLVVKGGAHLGEAYTGANPAFLNLIGAALKTMIRLGVAPGSAPAGVTMRSAGALDLHIGARYDGAAWIAEAASATIVSIDAASGFLVYQNTGLTAGQSFVPRLISATGGSGASIGNDLILDGDAVDSFAALRLKGDPAAGNYLQFYRGAGAGAGAGIRWNVYNTNSDEAANSVGSDLYVDAHDNNGGALGTVLKLVRATGDMLLALGNLVLGAAGRAKDVNLYLKSAAGRNRQIVWTTGEALRWVMQITGGAEAGGNAGSDFVLSSYNDAGALQAQALSFTRATGNGTMHGDLRVMAGTYGGGLNVAQRANVVKITGVATTRGPTLDDVGSLVRISGNGQSFFLNSTAENGAIPIGARIDVAHWTPGGNCYLAASPGTYMSYNKNGTPVAQNGGTIELNGLYSVVSCTKVSDVEWHVVGALK